MAYRRPYRISAFILKGAILFLGVFCSAGLSGSVCSAGEPVNIVFLTWKPNQPGVWNRLIERFERQNPDIRVKLQVGPHSSNEYHAIVSQRLKNRDASVDVFFMDVIWPAEFANAGWAMDLTSRFGAEERKRHLPGPIAANTYKNRIWGAPCYLGAGLFYYRKDLLEKYRFEKPKTWEEMLSQGERILKGEDRPGLYIYSGQFKQYEGLVCNMLEFIWSNGGDAFDEQKGKATVDLPSVEKAVSFVRDRIIGGAAPAGAVNYEEPESLSLFIQGRAIFHRNWPYAWAVANDPERSKVAGKVAVGSLPSFSGHEGASTLGGWQFGISRWSEHPDEAFRFVRFMSSYESQKTLALEAGLAPTRKAVYQDPEVKDRMPQLLSFLPVFERARPRLRSPLYPMISQELQRFFSRSIVDKGSDISAMAGRTSANIERLLRLGAALQP